MDIVKFIFVSVICLLILTFILFNMLSGVMAELRDLKAEYCKLQSEFKNITERKED